MPTVDQLWIAPDGGAPMESHDALDAVAGSGFRGDRYFKGTGYFSPHDECQATFVSRQALTDIRDEFDIDLFDGRHRRNVVVAGIDVLELLNARFRIGDALFEGTRPRPSCGHVEEVANEAGLKEALKKEHGGICADIVVSGRIEIGDELAVVERLDGTAADADRACDGER